MSLMKGQTQASPRRGLPIEEKNDRATIITETGETVQFFYSNSGVRTQDAGQAAGVAVEAVLAYDRVKNSTGRFEATVLDTSLSFTSTAFTEEVPMIEQGTHESLDEASFADRLAKMTADLSNGQYRVDYAKGVLYGIKASTQTSLASATYKTTGEELTATVTGGATAANQATQITAEQATQAAAEAVQANTDAWTPTLDATADETAVALVASAGELGGVTAINGDGTTFNSAPSYIQFFNVAQGSVTVGATTPDFIVPVNSGGLVDKDWPNGIAFDTAITYAVTTTPTGSTGPTTDLVISFRTR